MIHTFTLKVSTHSRAEAAASSSHQDILAPQFQHTAARRRLLLTHQEWYQPQTFQHTAARRRLHNDGELIHIRASVSTHSRAEAADDLIVSQCEAVVFQHTAARRRLGNLAVRIFAFGKFQHTAARRRLTLANGVPDLIPVSTHSRAEAAEAIKKEVGKDKWFQHTAARRRLCRLLIVFCHVLSFNTQPPEGGCNVYFVLLSIVACFNTQPPEGGCF